MELKCQKDLEKEYSGISLLSVLEASSSPSKEPPWSDGLIISKTAWPKVGASHQAPVIPKRWAKKYTSQVCIMVKDKIALLYMPNSNVVPSTNLSDTFLFPGLNTQNAPLTVDS